MTKQSYIDELKTRYIGKTFNWLTVIDIVKNATTKRYMFVCTCKCGNIKQIQYDKVVAGTTKSCGCYKHSAEYSTRMHDTILNNEDTLLKITNASLQWRNNNPDKVKEISDNYRKWCINHKDDLLKRNSKISDWCKSNPDKVKERSDKFRQWCTNHKTQLKDLGARCSAWFKEHSHTTDLLRDRMITMNQTLKVEQSKHDRVVSLSTINNNFDLRAIIHSDDIIPLLNGDLRACDKVRSVCPICKEYDFHNVRDLFDLSKSSVKQLRLCRSCLSNLSTSAYEQEIANYISTFYTGKLTNNDRVAINPFELDLYYPEKKIAIEFNGDYWHSSKFKDPNYHYNKFLLCMSKDILLVSIFEHDWCSNKEAIKQYLHDLFNGKDNSLSFDQDHLLMNNNFQLPNTSYSRTNYIEDSYKFNEFVVYTCGYSKIS